MIFLPGGAAETKRKTNPNPNPNPRVFLLGLGLVLGLVLVIYSFRWAKISLAHLLGLGRCYLGSTTEQLLPAGLFRYHRYFVRRLSF